jgi:hypothetical protein
VEEPCVVGVHAVNNNGEFCLPGYNSVYSVEREPTFRWNTSASYAESKNKSRKKPARKQLANIDRHGLFFDPEDGSDMFFRNVG